MSIAFYWLYFTAWIFFDLSLPYNVSKHPIDKTATAEMDAALLGKFYLWEDSSKLNHFAIKKGYEDTYHITYMNRGGTHPWMELDVEMSKIRDARFLNFRCVCDPDCQCYLLLRILSDENNNNITAPVINGAFLEKMTNSKEVLAFLEKNLDNPVIYQDTLHFSRVPANVFVGSKK